jgi:Protein of unknown function (DUF2735)
MNTGWNHGSAKIYQFPVGGRSATDRRGHEETRNVNDPASSPASEVAYSDAWYHEAAIQESKPVRER